MSQSLPPDAHERLLEALFGGNKIQAIKIYREATGQGLKESKDVVDGWENELRRTVPERFVTRPAAGSGLLVVAVVVLIFAAFGTMWYVLSNH
ncbi:MAG: ribosomal protein L7/L12 [Pirellulales bacterium]